MKRVNKKLLEALDKLIAKYSGDSWHIGERDCPLCTLFWNVNCDGCPNYFFRDYYSITSCGTRSKNYPSLDYGEFKNANTLKQFWTDYKSLYLQRKYSNSEIMEILITPFKEEKK